MTAFAGWIWLLLVVVVGGVGAGVAWVLFRFPFRKRPPDDEPPSTASPTM